MNHFFSYQNPNRNKNILIQGTPCPNFHLLIFYSSGNCLCERRWGRRGCLRRGFPWGILFNELSHLLRVGEGFKSTKTELFSQP